MLIVVVVIVIAFIIIIVIIIIIIIVVAFYNCWISMCVLYFEQNNTFTVNVVVDRCR